MAEKHSVTVEKCFELMIKQPKEGKLGISKERVFQMVGATVAKLREPKRMQTRGTDDKLIRVR